MTPWKGLAFRRVLFNTDVLANSATLLLLVLALARLQEHKPAGQRVQDVYMGPKLAIFSVSATVKLYAGGAVIALLLLSLKTEWYFRHRLAVCLALRLTRLTIQLTTALTPAATATLATSVADRVMANPRKAVGVAVLQPMVFYMQTILILMPWRVVLTIQAISTCAMLHYMWQFPCHLQQLLQLRAASSSYPWQADADAACSRLQSYAALIASAVGVPESGFTEAACQGTSSMQALQVFGTLICLFLLPVLITFELECWLCRVQTSYSTNSSSSGGGGGSSSSISGVVGGGGGFYSQVLTGGGGLSPGSSRDSSSSGASSSSAAAAADAGGASSSRSAAVVVAAAATDAAPTGSSLSAYSLATLANQEVSSRRRSRSQFRRLASALAVADRNSYRWHVGTVLLVVLLLMPMFWLLSELIAQLFDAHRDCPAVLAAARD